MKKMKRIKVNVTANIDVPVEFYDDMTNKEIEKLEKNNYQEWILDNIESESVTVIDIEVDEEE